MSGRGWAFPAAVLGVAAVGLWVVESLPAGKAPASRLGVLVSAAVGLAVLGLKGLASRRSLRAALGWSVGSFFLRLGVWTVTFWTVRRGGGDAVAFTAAFFAVFAVLLCLEVGFVLSVGRRPAGGVT